jgi:acylphosphatase
MIRRRVIVHGQVQGVFFRARCADTAQSLGVAGWVSNEPDGTVQAVFEGDEGSVEGMVAWCHEGSPRAVVERVEVHEEDPRSERGFSSR